MPSVNQPNGTYRPNASGYPGEAQDDGWIGTESGRGFGSARLSVSMIDPSDVPGDFAHGDEASLAMPNFP